jgi:hypothetical protein
MEPRDEFTHDYPRPLTAQWKENWYFNFIDRERSAWGINHVSIMRRQQEGRFSAFHVVDGEALMYSNVIPIGDDFSELTDGKLKFEFREPFRSFRLSFQGPRHQVELDYEARFPIFDYAMARRPGRGGPMALEHYEQALTVKGKMVKEGKTRELSCLGHRDHSWGYRNESKITGWNWVAIQFADKTVNLYRALIGQAFIGSGFVSSAAGNLRMVRMNVEDTRFEQGAPVSSIYAGVDEQGGKWRFRSERFSTLFLPLSEKAQGVVIHENFAEFENLETGEKGVGIDEYLINPKV